MIWSGLTVRGYDFLFRCQRKKLVKQKTCRGLGGRLSWFSCWPNRVWLNPSLGNYFFPTLFLCLNLAPKTIRLKPCQLNLVRYIRWILLDFNNFYMAHRARSTKNDISQFPDACCSHWLGKKGLSQFPNSHVFLVFFLRHFLIYWLSMTQNDIY